MMILLVLGMIPTVFWILFHVEDWRDEVYILSQRKNAIIYQSRHPFSYETGRLLRKQHIGFTTATLGLTKEKEKRVWSFGGFFYWLFGCGSVSAFGPSARIMLEMYDVFDPHGKKEILDRWLEEGQ